MVRAMFEASAPKYKFGGSSEKLENGSNEKTKQTDQNRRGKRLLLVILFYQLFLILFFKLVREILNQNTFFSFRTSDASLTKG